MTNQSNTRSGSSKSGRVTRSVQEEISKATYERVAAIAEALPEASREEFAALLSDLDRASIVRGSIRGNAIRRWLRDAGWRS